MIIAKWLSFHPNAAYIRKTGKITAGPGAKVDVCNNKVSQSSTAEQLNEQIQDANIQNADMGKIELEIEQVVETLEEITRFEKPDFERANNQTFINSVGQCVNYIYNTTTDVIPVNFEVLLAQAALESGWGNSRFALEGKNLFGIRTYNCLLYTSDAADE